MRDPACTPATPGRTPLARRLAALLGLAYDRLGDPRTKNLLIVILALMSAFGILAPETATRLRDAILSLAL
jgi:hypothetical protein